MTMMNSVKRILLRRSGTRNELRNAFSTPASLPSLWLHFWPHLGPGLPQGLRGTAGRLDLRLGGRGERVRLHGGRLADLAPPEHLDLRALVRQPMCVQVGGRDLAVEVGGEH